MFLSCQSLEADRMRTGQVSVDYAGGSMIFFVSLIFVVTGVLGTVPQFSEAVANDRLETVGWSLSTHLLEQPGHWQQGDQNRTDWHNAPSPDMIDSIGLAAPTDGISLAKIEALDDLNQTDITRIANIEQSFNLDVVEYKIITTDSTFEKGSPPWAMDPVTYEGNGDMVWYGAASEQGTSYYFLIDYGPAYTIYVSESRSFDSYETVSAGNATILDFGDKSFILDFDDSGISQAGGKQLILERSLGRIGPQTPPEQAQTVNIERYSWTGTNPVRLTMEVWE